MKTLTLNIPGKPVAQPRPRAVNRGRHAGIYNPKTADAWKKAIQITARAVPGVGQFEGAVYLRIRFRFARPMSHFNSKGDLKPSAPLRHTGKPDLDNLAKSVCDALTTAGIWRDDSQIDELLLQKNWTRSPENEGAEITIFEQT